jgi:predicted nucleic acid-binding protein
VSDVAVCNASPVIFLGRSGRLELLREFYAKILIPEQVCSEILARGERDQTVRAMAKCEWLVAVPVTAVPRTIEGWGLGAGESAVLALAGRTPGATAIIDDLAGRKCASSLRIPVRGTLGLVLAAKQRGYIPLARPVLDELLGAGLYLSRRVIEDALRRVGEQ